MPGYRGEDHKLLRFHHHHDSRCPDADGDPESIKTLGSERELPLNPTAAQTPPKRWAFTKFRKAIAVIEGENLGERYGDKLAVEGLNFVVDNPESSPGSSARTAPAKPRPCG